MFGAIRPKCIGDLLLKPSLDFGWGPLDLLRRQRDANHFLRIPQVGGKVLGRLGLPLISAQILAAIPLPRGRMHRPYPFREVRPELVVGCLDQVFLQSPDDRGAGGIIETAANCRENSGWRHNDELVEFNACRCGIELVANQIRKLLLRHSMQVVPRHFRVSR